MPADSYVLQGLAQLACILEEQDPDRRRRALTGSVRFTTARYDMA